MGRKLKYKTTEEKRQAICDRAAWYYFRNRSIIKQKNLRRYYENKRNIQNSQ